MNSLPMHTLNHAACLVVCATLLAVVRGATAQLSPNEQIVFDHVAQQANLTFRNSTAYLKYPYLVPAGEHARPTRHPEHPLGRDGAL